MALWVLSPAFKNTKLSCYKPTTENMNTQQKKQKSLTIPTVPHGTIPHQQYHIIPPHLVRTHDTVRIHIPTKIKTKFLFTPPTVPHHNVPVQKSTNPTYLCTLLRHIIKYTTPTYLHNNTFTYVPLTYFLFLSPLKTTSHTHTYLLHIFLTTFPRFLGESDVLYTLLIFTPVRTSTHIHTTNHTSLSLPIYKNVHHWLSHIHSTGFNFLHTFKV